MILTWSKRFQTTSHPAKTGGNIAHISLPKPTTTTGPQPVGTNYNTRKRPAPMTLSPQQNQRKSMEEEKFDEDVLLEKTLFSTRRRTHSFTPSLSIWGSGNVLLSLHHTSVSLRTLVRNKIKLRTLQFHCCNVICAPIFVHSSRGGLGEIYDF